MAELETANADVVALREETSTIWDAQKGALLDERNWLRTALATTRYDQARQIWEYREYLSGI